MATSTANCAPPSDLWADARKRYEDSDDLWTLIEGLHTRLSEYRRGTNLGYFNYYCSLYADVPEDDAAVDNTGRVKLAQHAQHVLEQMPWDGDHRGLHVVMSNDKRRLINQRCNKLQRLPNAIWVESPDAGRPDGEPSFWCYPSQQLQARVTHKKHGVFKNVLYNVQAANAMDIVLKMSPEYADGPQNFIVPIASVGGWFRMAYAVVYLNVQGRTISEGSVILWDTLRPSGLVHKYLTLRHFIVGLQRVRHPQQLKIASFQQEKAFLGVEVPDREEPVESVEPDESDSDDDDGDGDQQEQPAKRRRV